MKIIQIMPAPSGMSVQYSEHDAHSARVRLGNNVYARYPIACLALVEEDNGETKIKPMILENDGTFSAATDYPDLVSMSY